MQIRSIPNTLTRLRSQYQQHIDSQYRRPRGIIGAWIGRKMAQQHQPENQWTVKLLDVQPGEHILEIGFAPGIAIEEVLKYGAHVSGLDFSATMVEAAKNRNRDEVRAGRLDLRLGDAAQLPFADGTFDKAYSIHSIYFWKQPLNALREIYRVLKPEGLLIFTVLPKEKWVPEGSDIQPGTPECTPYSGSELQVMLQQAGFSRTDVQADKNTDYRSNYSVIGSK